MLALSSPDGQWIGERFALSIKTLQYVWPLENDPTACSSRKEILVSCCIINVFSSWDHDLCEIYLQILLFLAILLQFCVTHCKTWHLMLPTSATVKWKIILSSLILLSHTKKVRRIILSVQLINIKLSHSKQRRRNKSFAATA